MVRMFPQGAHAVPVARTILDGLDEPSFVLDAAGRIEYLNRAAEALLSTSERQCAGTLLLSLLPAELRPRIQAVLRTGSDPGGEPRIQCSSLAGGSRLLRIHAAPEPSPAQSQPAARIALERKLAETQAHLQIATQAFGLSFYDWDVATGALRLAEDAQRLAGFGPGEFDGSWETWVGRLLPQDAEAAHALFERLFRARARQFDCDHRLTPPDAPIRWLSNRGRIDYDPAGRPVRVIGVLVESSSRKRAEETRRILDERFRAFCENGTVAIYYGAGNTCEYVNPAWQRLSGLSFEESLGAGWLRAVHPEDRDRLFREWQDRSSGDQEWQGQYRILRPDGAVRWVSGFSCVFRDPTGVVLGYIGRAVDITAEKEAAQALQKSEEQLRLARSAGGVGLFDWDVVTGAMLFCEQMERLFGLAPGTFEGTYQAWERRVNPDDAARIAAEREECRARQQREHSADYRVTLPDGRVRWLCASTSYLYDSEGRLVRARGAVLDITDRRRAEEKLSAAVDRLRAATEKLDVVQASSGAAFWEAYPGNSDIWCSDGCYELFGFPRPLRPTFSSWLEVVHPGDRDRMRELARRTWVYGRDFQVEYRIRRRGETRWIESHGRVFRDEAGQPARIAGMEIDITALKQIESQLSVRESQLRAITETVPAVLFTGDVEGRTLYCSKQFSDYTGLPVESAQGAGWLAIVHPDDIPGYYAALERGVEAGAFEAEFRVRRWDGTYRWFRSNAVLTQDAAGGGKLWIGVSIEVEKHQRRHLEALLSATSDQLCLWDRNKRYLYINRGGLDLVGKTADEVIGKTWQELGFPAFIMEPFEADVDRVFATGESVRAEGSWPYEDRRRYFEYIVNPIFSGNAAVEAVAISARDITARKEAEDELRQTSGLLKAIFKHSPPLVFAKDVNGKLTHASDSVLRVLGKHAGELVGRLDSEFHSDPDLGARSMANDRAVRESGRPFVGEENCIAEDGALRTFLTTKAPWLDEAGRLLGTFGISVDITERKHQEQALRESEEQFRTLANAIPQLAWMADAAGRALWFNQRWYEYTGASAEQLEAAGWRGFLHPDHAGRVAQGVARSVASGDAWEDVFPLRGKSGEYRWFLSRALPIHDAEGKIARWFGTSTDITAQRATEEALRQSQEQFRRLYESRIIGILSGEEDTILEANDVFLEMVGYTREDLEARRLNWSRMTPPEYRRADQRTVEEIAAKGYCEPLEKEYYRKDGTRVPILIGVTQLSQSPSKWLCFVLDLTERKRLERKLHEKQKFESIGLLAGGVAHDFNNILVGILGNASLAQEIAPHNDALAPLLADIVRAGERAAHLTQQMLAYSGRGRFNVEPVNLSALLRDMKQLLNPVVPDNVLLHYDLQADLPPTQADPEQMRQLILNLVMNAVEAIGDKAGVISVRTGVQEVDAAFMNKVLKGAELEPGAYVWLELRDTGCGFDEATAEKIFDPFFTTKFTGRGLGLSAVAGIVRGHKGAITVSSTPTLGSAFLVFLPVLTEIAQPQPASAIFPETPQRAGAATVLVVDDEEVVRRIAKIALERHGYEVLLADSGPAAIEILAREKHRVSLVILDLSMPGMSGRQALPHLRRIKPDLRVLISSGYSETETMQMFEGEPISAFVQKPYTASRLAQIVIAAVLRPAD